MSWAHRSPTASRTAAFSDSTADATESGNRSVYEVRVAAEQNARIWWADYEIGYLYFDAQKFELARPFLVRIHETRHIASVARDLDTIEKILSFKRAREGARK